MPGKPGAVWAWFDVEADSGLQSSFPQPQELMNASASVGDVGQGCGVDHGDK